MKRLALIASLGALSLASNASPSSAAVTLGQLAPGTSPEAICDNPDHFDYIQLTVTSGNSYVVPGTGTITSWSHNAAAGVPQYISLKVFRLIGPETYQVVGHNGPTLYPLTESAVNTFGGFSIPVKPGDLIGLREIGVTACRFSSGDVGVFLERDGDLWDFQAAPNWGLGDSRLNITAVFNPSNTFTVGGITRNQKKGTATLNLTVPNSGGLRASGKGVKAAAAGATISKAVTPGAAQLLIKAKGKQAKTLNATGEVKLTVTITYTPTDGSPGTQPVKVKLKKR